jgi:hypothetical protein|tara:strand:- start:276 stop:458 length:183 start_codon:yes stop_codon:yes gene_type:complete
MSEDFDIQGDKLFFNGDLIGHLTIWEGTLRERAVHALLTHVSIEDHENGLDSDDNYPADD